MIQEINSIFFHSPIASLNFVSVSILSKNATTAPTVIETTKIVASKAKMRTIVIFSLEASWYSCFTGMVLDVLTGYLKLFCLYCFLGPNYTWILFTLLYGIPFWTVKMLICFI